MTNASVGILRPEWQAPPGVRSAMSLRTGGASRSPWDSLNLATHVQDDIGAVTENRRRLHRTLVLPAEPLWLQQVHGNAVHVAVAHSDADGIRLPVTADAAVTRNSGTVLAIQVADCMPVLFCDDAGSVVGAAHAGWRGLAAGVLEATVAAMHAPAASIRAWLGPAISRAHFEVGAEVRSVFIADDAANVAAFAPNARGRWQCDLAWLARCRLNRLGIDRVTDSGICTFTDTARCFSYRRDGQTGRMAALVWLAP